MAMDDKTKREIATAIRKSFEVHEASYCPGKTVNDYGHYTKTKAECINEVCKDPDIAVIVQLMTAYSDGYEWADRILAKSQ